MPSADDNKRAKAGRIHLLRLTIFGQTTILGFAWGFIGAILFQGVIALPDKTVDLIVEYPTVLTLIVTLISTALSIITSSFFTFAVKEALRYHLSGAITLFKLRTAIALSRPTWVLRWRYLKLSALTLTVFAMIEFLNTSWSTLLLPTLVQWPVPLSGTELNLGSLAFADQLSEDISASNANSALTQSFESINILALLSGISAVNVEGGVQTNSVFSFNGVSYSRSTGGVLPAVQDYAGSSNKASLVGLEFSGGEVPVSYSFDWGRDWRQSDTRGISKNYTVTQQGFTANVTCQAIDRSVDSFSLYPYVTQGPLNNTFLSYVALANCSGNTNTMTYFTVGNASSQMDPGSQGFLPTIVCPSPEDATFNPYKFDIFMSGLDKYAFLPTTACEVVPYVTTVNVTYNGAIVSVDQVGTSSDFTSNSNMPLSQYVASVMNYQAGSNQAPTKNTIGDFLTAYGTSNTTQIYSELEDYWRGIVEFSATQLRSGYSAAYPSGGIPSNMTTSTTGTMYITTYGWKSDRRTFFLLLVVITLIWATTVLAAAYGLIKEKYLVGDSSFDFSDPVHLIVAASAGGLEVPLRELDSDREREDLMVQFVDVYDKEGERISRKLVSVSPRPNAPGPENA